MHIIIVNLDLHNGGQDEEEKGMCAALYIESRKITSAYHRAENRL